MKRNAFTMIELVFIIVILGILAGVAIPRLAANRLDAEIAKYKSDISAIRSSIVTTRSQSLLTGNAQFPDTEGAENNVLFEGVLDYPIRIAGNGQTGWRGGNVGAAPIVRSYTLRLDNTDISFMYTDDGRFECLGNNDGDNAAIELCDILR